MSRFGGLFESSIIRRGRENQSDVRLLLVGLNAVVVAKTTLMLIMWF